MTQRAGLYADDTEELKVTVSAPALASTYASAQIPPRTGERDWLCTVTPAAAVTCAVSRHTPPGQNGVVAFDLAAANSETIVVPDGCTLYLRSASAGAVACTVRWFRRSSVGVGHT